MILKQALVLFAVIFTFFPVVSVSFAQENPVSSETAQVVPQKSTYTLPFPGMLPDNPLYFLKELRDGVIGFLISDPLKKAEFDLLKANKKIAEGVFLVNHKQNDELAVSSVEEGNAFFADAITQIQTAKQNGMDTTALLGEMKSSAQKHEEVLTEMFEKTGNTAFEERAKKAAEFVKNVERLQMSQ